MVANDSIMFMRRSYQPNAANVPSLTINKLEPLFVFLQVFGGQIGMPLFVGTLLFAPTVKRHLTLVNFCISWIIYSIVYCLTIYHKEDLDHGVGHGLCIAQAAMVHGVVPFASLTYCTLHIQVWMAVRGAFNQTSWLQRHRRKVLITMFLAPYVILIAFSVGSLAVTLQHPEILDRTGAYYCTLNYNPLAFAVPAFAAGIIAIMIALEVIIGITLIRRWNSVRRSQRLNSASLSMIVRIAIFSIYGFATLGACAAFLARSLTVWPYFIQASLPTAVFLMFGTRKDVLHAWCLWIHALCFWRRQRLYMSEERPASIHVSLATETCIENSQKCCRDVYEVESMEHNSEKIVSIEPADSRRF